jgi:hypothetical protein
MVFVELNWTREWWMVGLPCRVRETKERLWEWVRCQQRKFHFHLFLSFFVWIEKRKLFFLIHRPTTIVSTIAHRRRLKVINHDKILSNWFQYKELFDKREEEKKTFLLRFLCIIYIYQMIVVVEWSPVVRL